MDLSPAQIDARNALRLHPKPRDRRAVLAGKEALRFRYETKEFFDVDVTTFVDLYARLPPSGLARVALAPDVINNSGRSEDVFNAYWDELYADTRSEEPLLAALFLVEVAEHGIHQIQRSGPEASVVNSFSRQVTRLKKVLCSSKAVMARKRPHVEILPQGGSSLSAAHNRHIKKHHRRRQTRHVMETGQVCPDSHTSTLLAKQRAAKGDTHGLHAAGSRAERHDHDGKYHWLPLEANSDGQKLLISIQIHETSYHKLLRRMTSFCPRDRYTNTHYSISTLLLLSTPLDLWDSTPLRRQPRTQAPVNKNKKFHRRFPNWVYTIWTLSPCPSFLRRKLIHRQALQKCTADQWWRSMEPQA
ncbi:hypothetical protein Purlil1_12372 [Purpureocillium lilacinum]|uniref:Uncharacterized protein n=1 Tax=Purpureocillium lilacinum TaxID=33203 RepID=A0ABR0BI49_PURLI|nr:hypothetical protein Purlil1_12372 [Purpureocillium lilacinum]